MKRYQAILFDLDGTLLPMDQEKFLQLYFRALCAKAMPFGYAPQRFLDAMGEGTVAMIGNDGLQTNETVFWKVVTDRLGNRVRELEPEFELFYHNEFHATKASTSENANAIPLVQAAHRLADRVILATNPVFPLSAVASRLSWIGLTPDDFDAVTYYGNSSYCKPNPAYFDSIFRSMNLDASQCLMVGNDLKEDGAVLPSGASLIIMGDCLIEHGCDASQFTIMTGDELLRLWSQEK